MGNNHSKQDEMSQEERQREAGECMRRQRQKGTCIPGFPARDIDTNGDVDVETRGMPADIEAIIPPQSRRPWFVGEQDDGEAGEVQDVVPRAVVDGTALTGAHRLHESHTGANDVVWARDHMQHLNGHEKGAVVALSAVVGVFAVVIVVLGYKWRKQVRKNKVDQMKMVGGKGKHVDFAF